MNAYKFYIWASCYQDDHFTHNSERIQVIHARNKIEAEKRITLSPEKSYPTSHARCSKEFVYNSISLGTVKRVTKTYYEYSSGRQQPLLQEDYKKQLMP